MIRIKIEDISEKARKKLKKATIANSQLLLKQARQQLKLGNFNIATFLAITSYEESLKYGLLNSFEAGIIDSKSFNEIWASHKLKILSHYATIRFSLGKDDKVIQEYHLPKNSQRHIDEVNEIKKIRENSLYVDYVDSLSIPKKINIAEAPIQINRAMLSIQGELFLDKLGKAVRKGFKRDKIKK